MSAPTILRGSNEPRFLLTLREPRAPHLAPQSSVAYIKYASLLFRGNLGHPEPARCRGRGSGFSVLFTNRSIRPGRLEPERERALSKRGAFVASWRGRRQAAEAGADPRSGYADAPKTSLQGRRAPWLQKSPLRAHGCPMPRSIRSTRARLRIRSAQSFIQLAPLVQSRSCRRPWIARARPLYLPRWSRQTWRAASHQLECQLWRPRLDACCGRSVVAAYVYARAAGL